VPPVQLDPVEAFSQALPRGLEGSCIAGFDPAARGNGAKLGGTAEAGKPWPPAGLARKPPEARPHCGPESGPFQ